MNSDLAIHRALSVTVEDKVNHLTSGATYSVRILTIHGNDGAYSLINVFPEEGSLLDLEIRASVGKAQEAA